MTTAATSPYAPTRRNSYLRRSSSSSMAVATSNTSTGAGIGNGGVSQRSSSSSSSSSSSNTTTAATTATAAAAARIALVLFVLRFWQNAAGGTSAEQQKAVLWDRLSTRGVVILRPALEFLQEWWNDGRLSIKKIGTRLKEIIIVIARRARATTMTSRRSPSSLGINHRYLNNSSPFPDDGSKNTTSTTSTTATTTTATTTTTVARIQDNQRAIRSTLDYWFGQFSPETAQKMLWMIDDSSVEHRRKVDAEITVRFESILLDLASSRSPLEERWKEWCLDPSRVYYGIHGRVAAIIVLDQFSRHMQRHYETLQQDQASSPSSSSSTSSSSPLPTQEALDQLALKTAKLLFDNGRPETFQRIQSMIPLPMIVFTLMPYRHATTFESIQFVQQCIEQCAIRQSQLHAMLNRFRKATNRRMAVLQDEARRTGRQTLQSVNSPTTTTTSTSTSTKREVDNAGSDAVQQQDQQTKFTDEDILETFAFETDMEPALKHPIHRTMVDFLAGRGIHPTTSTDGGTEPQAPPCCTAAAAAAVIVSLSGGVDSMVIVFVLSHLQKSCGYSHMKILAVHIDYANRPESGAEADFVRRYCQDTLRNVQYTCRRIGEVTRGVTARDDYERTAREIRYNSYREAVADAKQQIGRVGGRRTSNSGMDDNNITVGVMLGHHRGDLRENVLSNAHKGCGPLDLSGMTAVSKNDGIVIYRPLLPLEKSAVLDYAHKFGVPYFLDTTPHWSTRGKLRNKLLPLLEEIYGDGSMNNLSNLAVESDECRALLQQSMIDPFMKAIVRTPMGIILKTEPWKDRAAFFWKIVLREALHSAGLGMFSDKSVVSFLDRVRARNVRGGWLQCRKDYGVYLQADGRVFVLYPSSFPWHKRDLYNVVGQHLGEDGERQVGPWRVKAEVVKESLSNNEDLLSKKAVPNMDHFMQGSIDYYLETPCRSDGSTNQCSLPASLVFREFTRVDRPIAWKNADLKVQSILPILGNDAKIGKDDIASVDESTCIVRVSMELTNPE